VRQGSGKVKARIGKIRREHGGNAWKWLKLGSGGSDGWIDGWGSYESISLWCDMVLQTKRNGRWRITRVMWHKRGSVWVAQR